MAQGDNIPSVVEFSEDISSAEAPAPLPVGEYRGVIRHAEVAQSQKGTKYAAVTFHISPDQYPADFTDGNPDGTSIIFRRVSLEDTVQARYGLRRFLEAVGAPAGKRIDVSEWIGNEATVEVGHDTYEGVTRPVINRVRAA